MIQDLEYKYDFDKVIENIKSTGSIPKEVPLLSVNALSVKFVPKLSEFNPKEDRKKKE
ncbi:hypothetical protein AB9T89_21065 [Flavobacterium oncorhynchi]|uniref:hypothetical protein n=1 Tax=Flavobacterium oncorhynchi TaxID=728056 RepID=UPI00351A3E97